jgi:hypothetical protein
MNETCPIPKFERGFFNSQHDFSYLGIGEFGGKVLGLINIKSKLEAKIDLPKYPSIKFSSPKFVVLRSKIFDNFMNDNDLWDTALSSESNTLLVSRFLEANLPVEILGDLRSLLMEVNSPLAIRSSSLLEDAAYEPFAGVYGTKMIPNNQTSFDERFNKFTDAIKFVYASTFFKESKDYIVTTKHKIQEEKMAVIIQEVFGSYYGNNFYPDFSGVARSINFYPFGKIKPFHGIVNLAVGLGKTIVDSGKVWSYSPFFPSTASPFSSIKDLIKNTQSKYWAVNLAHNIKYDPTKEEEFLTELNLENAEYDGILKYFASGYDIESEKMTYSLDKINPRIINFSPLLDFNTFHFNDFIKDLLKSCEEILSTTVEIEFAAKINRKKDYLEFAFLQIRPMAVSETIVDIKLDELTNHEILAASDRTIGNGIDDSIKDVIFIKPDNFDKKNMVKIVAEIEILNKLLISKKKKYLLIGFGRWGSSDSWLGVPVVWSQISGARAIIESTLEKIDVDLSQGSHFFHNLSSFNTFYFSINYNSKFKIDWEWLNNQEISRELEYTKYITLEKPLLIKVDGRTGKGVIKR